MYILVPGQKPEDVLARTAELLESEGIDPAWPGFGERRAVSIERTFYCDGPDCERHVQTPSVRPPVFITVTRPADRVRHFCGWDCVLRYAGTREPEQVVSFPADDD